MSLNGLILAGGKSSRMGRDKGGLKIHGVSQVDYLTALLRPFVDEIFVSLKKGKQLENLKIIADQFAIDSPLNGILSAMKTSNSSWLVIAVDMPNITADAIAMLIKNRDSQYPATCFEMPEKGGPEPLFAIWEAHSVDALEKIISSTSWHVCPREVLKTLGARIIKGAIPAKVLANLNTPQELKEFVA